jgi:hypothetical protein
LFPEYTTNENGDVYPQHENYLTNWYLWKKRKSINPRKKI